MKKTLIVVAALSLNACQTKPTSPLSHGSISISPQPNTKTSIVIETSAVAEGSPNKKIGTQTQIRMVTSTLTHKVKHTQASTLTTKASHKNSGLDATPTPGSAAPPIAVASPAIQTKQQPTNEIAEGSSNTSVSIPPSIANSVAALPSSQTEITNTPEVTPPAKKKRKRKVPSTPDLTINPISEKP